MSYCYGMRFHAGRESLKMDTRKHDHYRENIHAFAVLWCSVETKLFFMCLAARIASRPAYFVSV